MFSFHQSLLKVLLLVCVVTSGMAYSQSIGNPLQAIPPNVGTVAPKPMIMLNMSKDHQLFYRAYNEFTDLNGDGSPDTTYNHSIDYYGYFDSYKCYEYSGTNQRFVATATVDAQKYCTSSWSGNFLNWATMTRMDVVRKVLYGGLRSTDTSTLTVLERAHLPTDAHSFAKYYNGNDLTRLTPFTAVQLATRNNAVIRGPGGTGTNYRQNMSGITICNTTLGATTGVNQFSHTNTNPPLMRVAFGDWSLWNAGERWQCQWAEERNVVNGNIPSITGLNAGPRSPQRDAYTTPDPTVSVTSPGWGLTTGGAGPDFVVRVEACPSSRVERERCRQYPNGNLKPIGLLQEFGENDSAEFGLLTGSFNRNISGGVLRRNMGSVRSEINVLTDGTFISGVTGIIGNLNRLKVYGYDYNDGTYASDGNCTFQLTSLTDNQCTSWGNPIGEMFLESLRYLAGRSPTAAFSDFAHVGSKDEAMGLTRETWIDPFLRANAAARTDIENRFGRAQCRPINALTFNASVNSYDRDGLGSFSDLTNATTVAALVNIIGVDEGIQGTVRTVGRVGGVGNRLCTAKTVTALGDVDGLCPDAPAYAGSYSLAGLGWWARTNRIRNDIPAANTLANAFKVNKYSVALNPGAPRITVVSGADATRRAVIQPAYRLNVGAGGGGTLVDFRIVTQTPTYGKYLLLWEDSEQGGDYDQDVAGILEYYVNGSQLRVVTQVFAEATGNPQGFGYSVIGTNNDGIRFHSGIENFSFTDSTNPQVTSTNPARLNASGGCNSCNVGDPATTATYTITGGGQAALLQDPLFYAAKWGGFNDSTANPTGRPDAVSKWDQRRADGSAGQDGIPDNYFVVFRADLLENALRTVFRAITSASNAAPATSATQLTAGAFKYIVKFDNRDASGALEGFQVLNDGTFEAQPSLKGHERLTLTPPDSRVIITNDGATGIPFRWASMSAAFRTTTFSGTETATVGEARINYLRGFRGNESPNGLDFRARNLTSIMGPIINGNPWLQTRPVASTRWVGNTDTLSYTTFRQANLTRAPILWASANDGFLHGFRASNLDPLVSFFPGAFSNRVRNLTNNPSPVAPTVEAFSDGSAFAGDVLFGGSWRTLLFQPLGRGGRGLYAWDVTDPTQFTEASAASLFRWAFTSANDSDFGYQLAENTVNLQSQQSGPIARTNDGRHALILGNGTDSSSGRAALFILYVSGPAAGSTTWTPGVHYRKLVLDNGPNNGLSEATWVDVDGNGTADYVYAGDRLGNLWKVDISSSTPSDWTTSYARPLYIAVDASNQRVPISTAVDVTPMPVANSGFMVTFATGRSVVNADFPDATRRHGIFGIWDRSIAYAASPTAVPRGLGELVTRTFVTGTTTSVIGSVSSVVTLRTLFGRAFNLTSDKGWYIPYSETSEMTLSNNVRVGSALGVTSITSGSALTSDSCDSGAQGILTFVNPLTGQVAQGFFQTITVRDPISGLMVTRAAASAGLADQKVRVVGDRTGGAASGGGINRTLNQQGSGGGAFFRRRVIGQNTNLSISNPAGATRSAFREIPGLRTGQ